MLLDLRLVPLGLIVLLCQPSLAGQSSTDSRGTPYSAAQLPPAGPTGTATFGLAEPQVSGPLCGIYSLLACLASLGIECDIQELWRAEFVGSTRGSSAAELVRAAEHCGAHVMVMKNLTHRDLARATTPMLLHMRANWSNAEYNHWVAFLGFEGDRVRVLDPPHPMHTLSQAELLAGWDGLAVALSRQKHDATLVKAARRDWALAVVAAGAILLFVRPSLVRFGANRLLASTDAPWRRLAMQVAGMLFAAGALAGLWHSVSPVGFFWNRFAVAEVTQRYYSVTVREVSREEVERVAGDLRTVIFDARLPKDFQRGAIPGAINFPVNATLPQRRELLRQVHPDSRIIIYCQSAGCPWSDKVAQFLKFNGYKNVAIYRGGYREWQSTSARHLPNREASE